MEAEIERLAAGMQNSEFTIKTLESQLVSAGQANDDLIASYMKTNVSA